MTGAQITIYAPRCPEIAEPLLASAFGFGFGLGFTPWSRVQLTVPPGTRRLQSLPRASMRCVPKKFREAGAVRAITLFLQLNSDKPAVSPRGRLVDAGNSVPLLALCGGWIFGAAKHCRQNELLSEGAGLSLAPESRQDRAAGQDD